MFGITEGMLHGALRKIKDSPPINRIKNKWQIGSKEAYESSNHIERPETSVSLTKKRKSIRPDHGLPDAYFLSKKNSPMTNYYQEK